MVLVTNTTALTLAAGQSLTFNAVKQTGCSEYTGGSSTGSQVYLKPNGMYIIDFSGTVSSTVAATVVQLQLAVNGAPQPETLRQTTITAALDLANLAFGTAVSTAGNCCFNIGSPSITVTNTGTTAVVVQPGWSLRIARVG